MEQMTLLEKWGSRLSRSRLGDALFGAERRMTRAAFRAMQEGYALGPWQLPPEQLKAQLQELDPYYLQDMVSQMGWDIIGGIGGLSILGSGAERQRAVESAERLFRYSPLAQFAVWLWSGWGLGDNIIVTPEDEQAQKDMQEFMTAERNTTVLGADNIKELSDWTLVTGNRFLVFFASDMKGMSEDAGNATMRVIEPEEITEIITNPADGTTAWFYKREYKNDTTISKTTYYPDWALYFSDEPGAVDKAWQVLVKAGKVKAGDERADRVQEALDDGDTPGTVAVIMHVSFNRKERGSPWGWPLFVAAAPWLRTHKQFAQTRLTAAISRNSMVRRYQVGGGSRAVASVKSAIASNLSQFNYSDSNPATAPGSDEVINKAVDVEDINLSTSAGDAKTDNDMFSWMALLGCGLFPISAGLDVARYATALQMDKAQSMLFESYQTFWSTQFKRITKIVLLFKERFSSASYTSMEADVSIDSFSLSDFPDVARALGQATRDMLTEQADAGVISTNAARKILQAEWRLLFQALGVSDQDLISDETWEIDEEPAPDDDGQPEEEPEEMRAQLAAMIRANVRANPALRDDALLLALMEIAEG